LGYVAEIFSIVVGFNFILGKSLEVIPLGTTYLRIGDDRFEW
jgi:hypothetical protein